MKSIIAILLFTLSFPCFADEWTSADTKRESVYLAFLAADWSQTRNVARNNWQGHYEQNPLFGNTHPSVDRVDIACVTTGLVHVYVAHLLPPEWRKAFQYVSIGIEGGVVAHNYNVGVKVRF